MTARVEVPGFRPYVGQHCETVATGSLLRVAGIELSEPMLFGLGEGLGFIFINLRTLMAYAGCILPIYHGNEAETDLEPVGDIDERPIFRSLYLHSANLHSRERCRCKYRFVKSLE